MNFHGGYKGNKKLIDLSVNLNFLMEKKYDLNKFNIRDYPDIDGSSLKELMTKRFNNKKNNYIFSNGAIELIYLFARSFRFKNIVVVEPTFNEYKRAFSLYNANIHSFKLENDFKLDKSKLIQFANKLKADLIIICNPNNPTGSYHNDIFDLNKYTNAFIFIDESFLEFSKPLDYKVYDRIFRLRSMTKFYSVAGIRIAYALSTENIIEKLNIFKEPWTMNSIAIEIFKDILNDEKNYNYIREYYSEEFLRIKSMFKSSPIEIFDSFTNFYLLRIKRDKDLIQKINNKGFHIRSCDDFNYLNNLYYRVNIRDKKTNSDFFKTILKIMEG